LTRSVVSYISHISSRGKAGKTSLANFLADASDTPSGEYRPTKGVRILEFESDAQVSSSSSVVGKGRGTKVEVEMWDASGDSA
jgi:Rab-like protein 5